MCLRTADAIAMTRSTIVATGGIGYSREIRYKVHHKGYARRSTIIRPNLSDRRVGT